MATANNAIYTPNPKTLTYYVLTLKDGREVVRQSDHRDVVVDGLACWAVAARRETARVVDRGNLIDDNYRWYEVELVDGSRCMMIGEGS